MPPTSQAVDMLIYKGREELEVRVIWHLPLRHHFERPCYASLTPSCSNLVSVRVQMVLLQHKQRHHLVCSLFLLKPLQT